MPHSVIAHQTGPVKKNNLSYIQFIRSVVIGLLGHFFHGHNPFSIICNKNRPFSKKIDFYGEINGHARCC